MDEQSELVLLSSDDIFDLFADMVPEGFVGLVYSLEATVLNIHPCTVVNYSAGPIFVSENAGYHARAAFFPISTFVDAGFAAAFVRDGQVYMRTEDIRVGEEGLLWEFDPTGILPSGNYTLNVRAWCVVQGAGIAYSLARCPFYIWQSSSVEE